MNRNILHLRVDGFPVAVERLRDSSLRAKPVVICSRHSPRSLIFSASREARAEGVWEGLPLTKALRRCRRLVVIPPDEDLYRKAADAISRVLARYSPLVELGRWGRFFVDMTGTTRLFGGAQDSAWCIRREVLDTVDLGSTLGIASNKLVSGVAARVVETHGDLYSVPVGSEASFLAPLRVRMLPAARDKKDRTLLEELNIRVIRQLAALSILQLTSVFGKRGVFLHRQALGIDDSPVRPPESKPFILEEYTLDDDTNDDGVLLGVLLGLTERACRRMRAQGVLSRTVWLHLRHTDGMDVTRCLRLRTPEITDPILFRQIESLFLKTCERRQRIRYMSLTFTDLVFPSGQLALFASSAIPKKENALVTALDAIRIRYGATAVRWGKEMNGIRIERVKPMETDCKGVRHVA
jgi:DNA polymerase-4